jgi:hypothetical protein
MDPERSMTMLMWVSVSFMILLWCLPDSEISDLLLLPAFEVILDGSLDEQTGRDGSTVGLGVEALPKLGAQAELDLGVVGFDASR